MDGREVWEVAKQTTTNALSENSTDIAMLWTHMNPSIEGWLQYNMNAALVLCEYNVA